MAKNEADFIYRMGGGTEIFSSAPGQYLPRRVQNDLLPPKNIPVPGA